MALNWDDRFNIGHELIDGQHKELIDTFNLFVAACKAKKGKETLTGTISFLEEYIAKHFSAEEELMRRNDYPETDSHIALHDEFRGRFKEMQDECANDGSSISLIIELNEFLLRWFIGHIRVVDSKLGNFLATK